MSAIDACDAFVAFADPELRELRPYRERVRQLGQTRFAKQRKLTFTIASRTKPPLTPAARDRLVAALPYYRKLDALNDPGSFNRVRKLLGRSAKQRGGTDADAVLHILDELKVERQRAQRSGTAFKYLLEEPDGSAIEVRPVDTIDLFLYGDVFHDDPAKAAALRASGGWENAAMVMQLESTMLVMLGLFSHLDVQVAVVFDCPKLSGST